MKRRYTLLLGALLIGCEDVETSMTIITAVAPDDPMQCTFTPDTDKRWELFVIDVANTDTLAMNLQVRNDLVGSVINLGSEDMPSNFTTPSAITPTRMDIRWECDSNGFSDELGSLYVPAFSTEDPFCLDE